MSRPRRLLLILSLILLLLISQSSAKTCSENLDCGSNTHYKYCNKTNGVDECVYCTKNSQCDVNNGDICSSDNDNNSHKWCEMKSLTSNFDFTTIVTCIVIFVGAFIAAGGGLGGGGIFVPVFILLLGFDTKSAAALSQATIFGGSLVNLTMNNREQHPLRKHRPLTDFNTILILEPMLLGGTVIGVLLNQILPDPIILACLLFVLVIAEYRMVKKGISQWRKENEEKATTKMLTGDYGVLNDHEINDKENDKVSIGPTGYNDGSYTDVQSVNKTALNKSYDKELQHDDGDAELSAEFIEELAQKVGLTPFDMQQKLSLNEIKELDVLVEKETRTWLPMLWMGCVWIIVSIFSLLRSGDFLISVNKCSATYWIFEFGVFPCLFVITFFIAKMNMNQFNRKQELSWKPAQGDIYWDVRKSLIYPSIAALSGLLGGLLGIGGGMIVSPLLLELGVLPRVASATSAVAVLMTSSSSTFQKVLLNMIRPDYMFFFMAIGIIGTFIGQTVVNVAIKKFGRNSIVIIAVASVIGLAIVLMGVNSVTSMTWTMAFDSVC